MIDYKIRGLPASRFSHLFGVDDATLERHGAKRYVVDARFGFPDRIELRDLDPGETALLVNYEHQPAATPYRASHAIFVCEGATRSFEGINAVPPVMQRRLLSLRGFDRRGMMIDADVCEGTAAEALIEQLFANPAAAYIHAHYARRGCFAARIDRA